MVGAQYQKFLYNGGSMCLYVCQYGTKMHIISVTTSYNDNSYGSGNIIPFCVLYMCLLSLSVPHPLSVSYQFLAIINGNIMNGVSDRK